MAIHLFRGPLNDSQWIIKRTTNYWKKIKKISYLYFIAKKDYGELLECRIISMAFIFYDFTVMVFK